MTNSKNLKKLRDEKKSTSVSGLYNNQPNNQFNNQSLNEYDASLASFPSNNNKGAYYNQRLDNEANGYINPTDYGNKYRNQRQDINYSKRDEYRSSYNTQGFDDSIYGQRLPENECGGSGYNGTTHGGVGNGNFRRYRNEDKL
jgi:hypothetical protein